MKKREDLIKIIDKEVDWKEAISIGVDLLVKNDIATNDLTDAIIKSTIEMGPYYVLMPKVALAHTSPGSYNKSAGLSLVIFKYPIEFSNQERHQVNLLFTLSAIDSNSHMDILVKFANLFSNNQIVDEILSLNDKDKILKILEGLL